MAAKEKETTESGKDQLEKGKKAIETHNEVFYKGEGGGEKEKNEEKDAEKWHNEG